MSNGQTNLLNAHDQAAEYIRLINEALTAEDTSEMKQKIEDALSFAQNSLDELDEAMAKIESPEAVEHIEAAMNGLVVSMDLGDQVLEASEDEVEDLVSEMRQHALEATAYLNDALAVTM
jgi:hypothetical protein